MDYNTLRVDIRVVPEVKQMLKDISEADSRSITREIEYLIKKRHREVFGDPNKKGGK